MVVMPNHLHGILLLSTNGRDESRPYAELAWAERVNQNSSLGEVVRSFKAVVARRIRAAGLADFAWQRNYYEHIIRNENALARIRSYVMSNPENWQHDPEREPANV
jgi:REP element-mobilizing transposase RayT